MSHCLYVLIIVFMMSQSLTVSLSRSLTDSRTHSLQYMYHCLYVSLYLTVTISNCSNVSMSSCPKESMFTGLHVILSLCLVVFRMMSHSFYVYVCVSLFLNLEVSISHYLHVSVTV
jgi:hypothetical protein